MFPAAFVPADPQAQPVLAVDAPGPVVAFLEPSNEAEPEPRQFLSPDSQSSYSGEARPRRSWRPALPDAAAPLTPPAAAAPPRPCRLGQR